MKFFIDTANIDEIKEAADLGILDGVTTNPSLLSKEIKRTGKEATDILKTICEIVQGPVNGEVVALDYKGIVKEGRELAKLDEHIVVKIPTTMDGIKAVRTLSKDSIHTNVTLCFSATQALMIAKAGATYVSPFVGRLDDINHVGMDLIADIALIYDNYGYETEIIVASIRSPLHVLEAARIGADISTIPYKVIGQLMKHPLTDIGIERFLDDWKSVQKK